VGMGKLMLFVCGLLFGVVGAFGTVVYLETHKPPQDDQLVFAQKNFWDSKQTEQHIRCFLHRIILWMLSSDYDH
jgi:hypothetical protein